MATRTSTPAAARTAHGAGRQPPPLHLFFGGDEYLVARAARAALDALCPPDDQALGVEEVDGRADNAEQAVAALRRCLDAARTSSLFGGRKAVWFRDATFLASVKLMKAAAVSPWLAELTELLRAGLPSGHVLVISAPGVDKRTALFKACKAAGEVREFAVSDKAYLAVREARPRAREAFEAAGLRAGADVIEALLERAGTDTRQIVQEVAKLAAYLGGRKTATEEDVREIVSPCREAVGWDYADAVAAGKAAAALTILGRLLYQGANGIQLVSALEWRFRELLVMEACLDRGWLAAGPRGPSWSDDPEAGDLLGSLGTRDPRGQHPYRVGILARQARGFRPGVIRRAQAVIVETREAMVSGFAAPERLLEFLTVRLAAGGRRG